MGEEQRCSCSAPAARCERAGIAMRHHVDRARSSTRHLAQQLKSVNADRVIDGDVLARHVVGLAPRGCSALGKRQRGHYVAHAIERPAEVDGGWPRRVEGRMRFAEGRIAGIAIERKR